MTRRRSRPHLRLDTPERRAWALEELDARIELLEFEVGLLVSRRERQRERPAETFESMIERLKALLPS